MPGRLGALLLPDVLGDRAPHAFRARNPLALTQPVERLELIGRKVYDGPHGVIISRYQMRKAGVLTHRFRYQIDP